MNVELPIFDITPQTRTRGLSEILRLGYKVDEKRIFHIKWEHGTWTVHVLSFRESTKTSNQREFTKASFTFLFIERFPDKGYVLDRDFESACSFAALRATPARSAASRCKVP